MDKIWKAYERFYRLLEVEKIHLNNNITFRYICTQLNINSRALDNLLFTELGLNGDEILKEYRRQSFDYLKAKYSFIIDF